MKWTLDEFLSGKFDVMCHNSKEFTDFMHQLDRMEIKWNNGMRATDWIWEYNYPICVRYNYLGRNTLTWNFYEPSRYTYEWCNYIGCGDLTKVSKKYKVVIECDGTTTTAKLIVDGKEVKSTTAKKHPEDKFNLKLGMETAFNRLWCKDESKTTKEAPKHDFKVGDRVVYAFPKCGLEDLKGKHGKILVDTGKGSALRYGIELDSPTWLKLSLCGEAKPGHGMWADAGQLTLETKKTT